MRDQQYFVWQVPSFTVRLSLDLIQKVNHSLVDPRRTADEEHGGILFGKVLTPELIEITGFEFLPSEHRRGISYDLSGHERARVARHVGNLEKRPGPRPVGFFRTHRRPGLFLDQSDFALMSEAFSNPSSVALVIRPEISGTASAGIFFWEEGDIDRKRARAEFPFDADALRIQGPIHTESVAPVPSRSFSFVPRQIAVWGTAALISVLTILAAMQFRPATPQPRRAPPHADSFNLRISRSGQAMLVDWDKDSPALRNAPAAVLTIEDGGSKQQLTLDRAELSHGSVQFWPRTDHVSVHMDVADPSPLVVAAPILEAPPPVPPEIPAVRRKAPPPAKPNPVPPIPPPVEAAVKAPEIVEPALPPSPPARVERPPEVTPLPPPVKRPEPAVTVAVTIEPKGSSELKKVIRHVPLLGRMQSFRGADGNGFVPARPNGSLKPRVPAYMASNLSNDVLVDVAISIDKHGVVKNTEVIHGAGTGFGTLAADMAGTVAWEPAQAGERPVASEVLLHYRFTRQTDMRLE